jgi:two-component system, NtrC family, response regulator AtoC
MDSGQLLSTETEQARVDLIGNTVLTSSSPAGQAVEKIVTEVAKTEMPVLIVGESGTGKEVTARLIHQLSSRQQGPFIRCACSTLGADALGKLLRGDDGSQRPSSSRAGFTLFLDGVSELRPSCQQKLLEFLPEDNISEYENNVAVRMISSTSRSLKDEVEAGRFREELYYRINGVCIRLPRLCQRKEDILALVDLFLTKYSRQFGRRKPSLSPRAVRALQDYSWPGNIRQLKNVVKRIVVLGDERLALMDLPPMSEDPEPLVETSRIQSLKEAGRAAARKAENHLILKALDRTRWNRKRAAKELGISYKALLYKLKEIGIDRSTKAD